MPSRNAGEIFDFLIKLLASGFYSGYTPFVPGTAGTFLGVLIYIFLMPKTDYAYFFTLLTFIILGIFLSSRAELIYDKKDDQRIVIDEITGYLLSMFLLPYKFSVVASGFVVFRIFDWVKPYPAKRLQNLKGGIGVMADDIIAGVYTCVCLHIINRMGVFKVI